MKSKPFAVLVIVAVICVCIGSPAFGKDRYIVHRDVPEKPVFTVIPFNNTLHQITFNSCHWQSSS